MRLTPMCLARAVLVLACAVSVTSAAGCSSSGSAVRLVVDQPNALVDAAVRIEVDGLKPAQQVTVRLSAADNRGITWQSSATFAAPQSGVLDLGEVPPRAGSYAGVQPMGLWWSMKPTGAPPDDTDFVYPLPGFTATLQAEVNGRVVARATLQRAARASGVTAHDLRPADAGFYGQFFAPTGASGRQAAVVVLGGSEGGLATAGLAELLASHGYPTLALAYFGEPGLPQGVSDIPLEYFTGAIKWLSAQPGVDPKRVDLLGISRGSEAALLVASNYPDRVHATIAAAPTSVVNPPQPGPRGSAWTMGGTPIASIRPQDFGQPNPAGSPDAVISVQQIPGRLMLVCGADDAVWPSCGYVDAIEAQRGAGAARDTIVRAIGAGHGVASLVPYISEASTVAFGGERLGGNPGADGSGRAVTWQRVLDFLGSA